MNDLSNCKSVAVKDWFREKALSLGGEVFRAVVTTLTLGFGFAIFHDYIASPPDLSGHWKLTYRYENTAYSKYRDLNVTYSLFLLQEGLNLRGAAEKLSDRSPTQEAKNYIGEDRVHFDLSGFVTQNYFSSDTVVFHSKEAGLRRPSSTFGNLVIRNENILCGCFKTTIADSSGLIVWQRNTGQNENYEPVEIPNVCDIDC